MNVFRLTYLIFSVIQLLFGIQSVIMSLAIYFPSTGFGFLVGFWLLNGIWLLVVSIDGIIYSIYKGGNRYVMVFFLSSVFIGAFLFGSILMMNPCGILVPDSGQCSTTTNINQNQIDFNSKESLIDLIYQPNESLFNSINQSNLDDDYDQSYGAYIFTGIEVFIQSIVSISKIITHLFMEWDKENIELIWLFTSQFLVGVGAILYLVIESLFWHGIILIPAVFTLIDVVFCMFPADCVIFTKKSKKKHGCKQVFLLGGSVLLIAAFILMMIFGTQESSQDTRSVSIGAGIVLMVFTVLAWLPFILCDRDSDWFWHRTFTSSRDIQDEGTCDMCRQCIRSCKPALKCFPDCYNWCHGNKDDDDEQIEIQVPIRVIENVNQQAVIMEDPRQAPSIVPSSSSSSSSSTGQVTAASKQAYEVIRKIKRGIQGTVSLAQLHGTKRLVAVKVIDYETVDEKYSVQQEYLMMSEIFRTVKKSMPDAPFMPFVEPLSCFTMENENCAYFILEYCFGGDFRDLINSTRNQETNFEEDKCWKIVRMMASALDVLHSSWTIHANLKPENVLFTGNFQIKLTDYGITQKLRQDRQSASLRGGAWEYLPPEYLPKRKEQEKEKEQEKPKNEEKIKQQEGEEGQQQEIDLEQEQEQKQEQEQQQEQEYDEEREKQKLLEMDLFNIKEDDDAEEEIIETTAADIWAMGVMLFELLAGYHPFSNCKRKATSLEIVLNVMNEQPSKLPEEYSLKLRNLIMRMLVKDPDHRVNTEMILQEARFHGDTKEEETLPVVEEIKTQI